MSTLKYGMVTADLKDGMEVPEQAGKMTPAEVLRLAKGPRGVGMRCEQVIDVIENLGDTFTMPPQVTPTTLRRAATQAEAFEDLLRDLTTLTDTVRQASLLHNADAYEQLRKVNDQVKAQGKYDDRIKTAFADLTKFFARD